MSYREEKDWANSFVAIGLAAIDASLLDLREFGGDFLLIFWVCAFLSLSTLNNGLLS